MTIGFVTFLLAVLLAFPSQGAVLRLRLALAFPVLLLIILVTVLADIIGVAAAVAKEAPFHAMAAKRINGARQALRVVRNGGQVNSFMADVVGDIGGTLAGAAGTAIVFRLVTRETDLALINMLVLGAVAALIVGLKATTKGYALRESTAIIYLVGRVLYFLETVFKIRLLSGGERRNQKKRGR